MGELVWIFVAEKVVVEMDLQASNIKPQFFLDHANFMRQYTLKDKVTQDTLQAK